MNHYAPEEIKQWLELYGHDHVWVAAAESVKTFHAHTDCEVLAVLKNSRRVIPIEHVTPGDAIERSLTPCCICFPDALRHAV